MVAKKPIKKRVRLLLIWITGLGFLATILKLTHYFASEFYWKYYSLETGDIHVDAMNEEFMKLNFVKHIAKYDYLFYLIIVILGVGIIRNVDFSKYWFKLRPKFVFQIISRLITFILLCALYRSYVDLVLLKSIYFVSLGTTVLILIMWFIVFWMLIIIDEDEKERHICEFC